jgi:anti-sigma factor NepR-like protein
MLRVGGSALSKSRHAPTALRKARQRLHALGARLRFMWDDIVQEPVPEEMMDLLRQIDERESSRSSAQ